jgi:hypothetical protein
MRNPAEISSPHQKRCGDEISGVSPASGNALVPELCFLLHTAKSAHRSSGCLRKTPHRIKDDLR